MRRATFPALFLLCALITSMPAHAGLPAYRLVRLGNLGGTGIGYHLNSAYGINNAGQIVGLVDPSPDYPNSGAMAFLWQNGTMQGLPSPGGSYDSSGAYAINSNGLVAGFWHCNTPCRWQDGVFTHLSTPWDVYDGRARGVNDSGRIVGDCYNPSIDQQRAILWEPDGSTVDLGSVGGYRNVACDINSADQVVGYSADGFSARAFLWTRQSGMRDLGQLYGPGSSIPDLSMSINDAGQVAGHSRDSNGVRHAFVWQNSVMQDIGPYDARAINSRGLVLASSYLWQSDTGWVSVSSLLDGSATGWTIDSLKALNDSGQLVGSALNPSGQREAILLTPVPEPSSIFALLSGLATLGFARKRRR